MKILMIALTIMFLSLMILLPIFLIFIEAFNLGWDYYLKALQGKDTISSIKLSVYTLIIVVMINTVFGVSVAWYVTKFPSLGKSFLTSIIGLPLSISPVISGMLFILTLGPNSFIGDFFRKLDLQIIFTPIAIVIVTLFVTLPFIAKELILFLSTKGNDDEEAAILLGANGFKLFFKITLPNILPALLYGILLTGARSLGEFGAVSVVSGHIQGETNTIPLQIEVLYNDYLFTDAFAISTTLMLVSFFTLFLRTYLQKKYKIHEH